MNTMGIIEILLIEDNSDKSSLIVKILGNYATNIHITQIEDGLEAMDYLYKKDAYKSCKKPSLILLDLNLPGKDGREVLEAIKTDDKLMSIPVIVLTNSDDNNDVLNSYEHYANAYITKSTDFNKFNNDITVFADFWLNNVILPNSMDSK
jgi:CheY-like chemotaxis protein